MSKRFQARTRHGYVPVPGYDVHGAAGIFAVTASVESATAGPQWAVTHCGSGLACEQGLTLRGANAYADTLVIRLGKRKLALFAGPGRPGPAVTRDPKVIAAHRAARKAAARAGKPTTQRRKLT